jgi:hypothetical protein
LIFKKKQNHIMSNTLIIKPKKNSKKFLNDAKMYQGVIRQTADGSQIEDEAKELGAYNKEKFIGSMQISRIAWSDGKQAYDLGDLSQSELDDLVKACGFRDEDNKLITTADRKNFSDPFFQHRYLKIHKTEGEAELNLSDPIAKLFSINARQRSIYKSGDGNPIMSARTKYILTDQTEQNNKASSEVNDWMEMGQLFGGLDSVKMMKVAVALQLGVQENSSAETVKNILGATLRSEENKVVKGSTETFKQAFKRLCTASSEVLDLEYKVTQAKRKGYLRRKKDQGWLFNGKPIASTENQLLNYFADPSNQNDFFELETLIGDTSKNSTQKSRSKSE